jgi:hypothetical protein
MLSVERRDPFIQQRTRSWTHLYAKNIVAFRGRLEYLLGCISAGVEIIAGSVLFEIAMAALAEMIAGPDAMERDAQNQKTKRYRIRCSGFLGKMRALSD